MKEYAVDSSSLLTNKKTEKTIWWLGSLYKIHMIMKKREEEDGGKPPFDLLLFNHLQAKNQFDLRASSPLPWSQRS